MAMLQDKDQRVIPAVLTALAATGPASAPAALADRLTARMRSSGWPRRTGWRAEGDRQRAGGRGGVRDLAERRHLRARAPRCSTR